MAPAKLKEKSYNDIVAAMKNHLDPPSSKLRFRYELFSSVHQPGESIPSFILWLQAIGQHCAYGDSTNEMLKDAFVFGINDMQIQCWLFQGKGDFTLQTTIELATAIELSTKDAAHLHKSSTQQVHKLDSDKETSRKITCYRCGGPHLAPQCRFVDAVCQACGRRATSPRCVIARPRSLSPRPAHLLLQSHPFLCTM